MQNNEIIYLNNAQSTLSINNIDLLFGHKKEISRKFSDILGLHLISHLSILLLNPNNEVSVISSTPSVEYNLIESGLWLSDQSFSASNFTDGYFTSWRNFYHHSNATRLILEKEDAHGFTYGSNLIRHIDNHCLVYSFATRSIIKDAETYYRKIQEDLLQIGNYAYNSIRYIFNTYNTTFNAPIITTNSTHIKRKPQLTLIKNSQY